MTLTLWNLDKTLESLELTSSIMRHFELLGLTETVSPQASILWCWGVGYHWRTQDFRMGGVDVPQAPRGVESGEPPHWGKVWGCAPSPEHFSYFFVKNTIF